VLLGNSAETLNKQERLLAMSRSIVADGVRLCRLPAPSAPDDRTPAAGRLPLILFTRYVDGVETAYVGADNLRGAELATEHLIGLGHRRIAFVGGPANSSARRDRLQGYRNALVAHGPTDRPCAPAHQLDDRVRACITASTHCWKWTTPNGRSLLQRHRGVRCHARATGERAHTPGR